MQNINFSKQIYEKNVIKGCIHILKRMQSKVSEDQMYRINTDNTITPEIPALFLKMGFDLEIFLSDDGEILNSLFICCKKENREGIIKKISCSGPLYGEKQKKMIAEYEKAVKDYLQSAECDEVLKKIERSLG